MSSTIVDFFSVRESKIQSKIFQDWVLFYSEQSHERLLDTLIQEHENNFPLRRSPNTQDQLRHKALIEVADKRAQTTLLKNFLQELKSHSVS